MPGMESVFLTLSDVILVPPMELSDALASGRTVADDNLTQVRDFFGELSVELSGRDVHAERMAVFVEEMARAIESRDRTAAHAALKKLVILRNGVAPDVYQPAAAEAGDRLFKGTLRFTPAHETFVTVREVLAPTPTSAPSLVYLEGLDANDIDNLIAEASWMNKEGVLLIHLAREGSTLFVRRHIPPILEKAKRDTAVAVVVYRLTAYHAELFESADLPDLLEIAGLKNNTASLTNLLDNNPSVFTKEYLPLFVAAAKDNEPLAFFLKELRTTRPDLFQAEKPSTATGWRRFFHL